MWFLDLTLPTPAENLALDEALLDTAEASGGQWRLLRLWEPRTTFVVLGRGSKIDLETDRAACAADGVPILRRGSGGGVVVAGPGCLMYAVVLGCEERPFLRLIDEAHRFVLERVEAALRPAVKRATGLEITRQGISDLTLGDRKFSGNSLRCKRTHVLYHGTLLYGFDLASVPRYLRSPERQPAYRAGRSHEEFVTNVPLDVGALRELLRAGWRAHEALAEWPEALTRELVATRYSQASWNEQR